MFGNGARARSTYLASLQNLLFVGLVLVGQTLWSGCKLSSHGERPEDEPGAPRASNEVVLTAQQIKDAQIETAPVAIQDVDDTILASGKVSFDDSLVSHVFSPISGRVHAISASLGQRVTAGSPLATI